MPKFVQGDMVMRTTYASVWIGRVYTSFVHQREHWYVGQTTEGLLWLAKEDNLQKFDCAEQYVKYKEKPNDRPVPVLNSSKY